MTAAPALWRPSLWLPPSVRDFDPLAMFTAGKLQRKSTGKALRKSTGKILENTATSTTCCCTASCWQCGGTMDKPTSWTVTLSGFPICTCGHLLAGEFTQMWEYVSGTLDGIYSLPVDPLSGGCTYLYVGDTDLVVQERGGTTACTGVTLPFGGTWSLRIQMVFGFPSPTWSLDAQIISGTFRLAGISRSTTAFGCTGASLSYTNTCTTCSPCGLGGFTNVSADPVF